MNKNKEQIKQAPYNPNKEQLKEALYTHALERLHQIGQYGEYEVTEVWCGICERTVKLHPSTEWIKSANIKCDKCNEYLTAWVRNKYENWKESAFLLATIKYDMGVKIEQD